MPHTGLASAVRRAQLDPGARARVVERRPLRYDAELAQVVGTLWVRAGSGLARFGKRLLMVQDDALWLPWLDENGTLHADPLPPDAAGRRLFDDKRTKPDFEAAAQVGAQVLLFGSGSLPSRERIVVVEQDGSTRLIEASSLYAALRAEPRFAGSGLNVEGAVVTGDRLLLCCRSNGAAAEANPYDATVELLVVELQRYLSAPARHPAPQLGRVEQYALGSVSGVRLTLTDVTEHSGRIYYLAAAEASANAVLDGPVLGTSLGLLGPEPRYALIETETGGLLCDKVEGLAAGAVAHEWLAIVDSDDAGKPAELLRLMTEGL